jgi:MFS family permease
MGTYFIFNANSTYLVEVSFGQSELSSSMGMFGFAVFCGLGTWFLDQVPMSVLSRGRWASGLLAISGIMSLVLTAFFPNDFWAYLVGSFVQASMMVTSQVGTATQLCDPQNRYRGSYHPYLRIDSFS